MKGYYWSTLLNEETFIQIMEFLLACKATKDEAVIFISSEGGYTLYIKALHEFIRDSKLKLTTVGIGRMYSSAAAFFCLGDERIIVPGTRMLIHNSRVPVSENMMLQGHELEDLLEETRQGSGILVDACTEKTKLTKEIIQDKCSNGRDWWVSPDEMKSYGLVTKSHEGWTDLMECCLEQLSASHD